MFFDLVWNVADVDVDSSGYCRLCESGLCGMGPDVLTLLYSSHI